MTGTRTTLYCCKSPAFIWDPAFNWDPAFIRTLVSEPRRLLETRRLFRTRRLIEVLRYVKYFYMLMIVLGAKNAVCYYYRYAWVCFIWIAYIHM